MNRQTLIAQAKKVLAEYESNKSQEILVTFGEEPPVGYDGIGLHFTIYNEDED